ARASAEIDLVADLRHHAILWLQWGRARASAEMSPTPATTTEGTQLQWGRARASAEIRRHALGVLAPFRLQWGRARASAEIRWAANVALWPLALQWGRARASAEIDPSGSSSATGGGASMGPRSCERGNRKQRPRKQRPPASFNGAALVRARK